MAAGATVGLAATGTLAKEVVAVTTEGPAKRMPAVFSAHGNPMNAVRTTAFTKFLGRWGAELARPKAILAISAHWEGPALAVTENPKPDTIHDFYGFPQDLFDVRYPAPGSPEVGERVRTLLAGAGFVCEVDPKRGLDHGVWVPLIKAYPKADVPVVQLSLRHGGPLSQHAKVGAALAPLRDEGVLILGSGNLVHNLGVVDFAHVDGPVASWAGQFDAWVKDRLDHGDLASLEQMQEKAPAGTMAHPTFEHYVPLLVVAGAAGPKAVVTHPFEGFEHGTISMRCVAFA